jgi:hypothetical protein
MHESGNLNWGKKGVAITRIGLRATPYYGEKFDNNLITIVPKDECIIDQLWTYCSSQKYRENVRQLDQKLSLTNATACKVFVDLSKLECIEGLPSPWTDDPTQWIFHGHPATSEAALQVAVSRLLGYRWPAELDASMELSDEARTLVDRCSELDDHTDDDGIACLPAVRGELPAAERIRQLLAAAFGDEWNEHKLDELLEQAGSGGKKLDDWLRDHFFEQHCKLFHHRPFIWQIWDGRKDGFSALVNYHKLDNALLQKLIYSYLDEWIRVQKRDADLDVAGADLRLGAAQHLREQLEKILKGEAPYDIFVRWKSLEKQPIGWNPDLNDGVRLNIRPFMTPELTGGKKGAGVLRWKPNIHWKKDRGKDVASAPWYKLGLEYEGKEGDRINDHHLSLSDKSYAKSQSSEFAQEIEKGESERREFKSTLRMCLREKKKADYVTHSALKTIAAFMNSRGGALFIGVEDDGNVLGIEEDNFENHDKFLLFLKDKMANEIGKEFSPYWEAKLETIDQRTACKVSVTRSEKPVYLGKEDEFYIRTGPSSEKLKVKEAVRYVGDHFE